MTIPEGIEIHEGLATQLHLIATAETNDPIELAKLSDLDIQLFRKFVFEAGLHENSRVMQVLLELEEAFGGQSNEAKAITPATHVATSESAEWQDLPDHAYFAAADNGDSQVSEEQAPVSFQVDRIGTVRGRRFVKDEGDEWLSVETEDELLKPVLLSVDARIDSNDFRRDFLLIVPCFDGAKTIGVSAIPLPQRTSQIRLASADMAHMSPGHVTALKRTINRSETIEKDIGLFKQELREGWKEVAESSLLNRHTLANAVIDLLECYVESYHE